MATNSKEYMRAWRAKNREKNLEYQRVYQEKHREEINAKAREKDRSEYQRQYRLDNIDRIRKTQKVWMAAHPGYENARVRDPELQRQYSAAYRARDIEGYRLGARVRESRRRARKLGNGGSHTTQEWVDLVNEFPICFGCGWRGTPASLQRDHITPISKGGTDDISNIQPLCGPCNRVKATNPFDYSIFLGVAV